MPDGILQLIEIEGDEKILLQELPMSSKNRDRINQMRHDMLLINPTRTLAIGENNSIRITRDDRVSKVCNNL